jgi:predicted TIM-barrel fold metal-dependent hydrolase
MFDINTAMGHWPFRRIPNQQPDTLRHLLEAHGIRGAAVANTHGLFYKNCHDANLELAEAIAPHTGFFVGVATLNPAYAAWERDLATCVERLGLRALRLAPQYHDYALTDAAAIAMVRAAAAAGLPVLVPHRVVDVRQRHWLDSEQTTSLAAVVDLCLAVPEARIVVTELGVSASALCAADGAPVCGNLYLETSRLTSCYGDGLRQAVKALGAAQVVFGSGAPFKEVVPALLKLQHAGLLLSERKAVAGGSARRLLGLDRG